MGRNPEFFVAGSYTSGQIVWFGAIVALVPSVVLVLVYVPGPPGPPAAGLPCSACWSRPWARCSGTCSCAASASTAAGLAIGRGGPRGGGWPSLVVRARAGRLLLQYLAVANVLFLVGFLFMSPVERPARRREGDAGALGLRCRCRSRPGPVVVIVFDELPLPTLMRSDGTINAERYPAFARLAEQLDVVPQHEQPPQPHRAGASRPSSPATCCATRAMPTYRRAAPQPARADGHVDARWSATRRSPTSARPDVVRAAGRQAALRRPSSDSLVVYGHRVLPARAAADLAPIDDAWGDFGGHGGRASPRPRRRRPAGARRTRQRRPARPLARLASTPSAARRPRPPAWCEQGLADRRRPRAPLHPRRPPARPVVRHAVGHPLMPPMPRVGRRPDHAGRRRGAA